MESLTEKVGEGRHTEYVLERRPLQNGGIWVLSGCPSRRAQHAPHEV